MGFINETLVHSLSPLFTKKGYLFRRTRSFSNFPPHLPSLETITFARNDIPDDDGDNLHESHITSCSSLYHEKARQLAIASTLSLAPMMDYTDRHFRHLVRLISSNTLLYSEMVTANAIVQQYQKYMIELDSIGKNKNDINFSNSYLDKLIGQGRVEPYEGPCVLQLGGSDPEILHKATAIVFEQSHFANHHKPSDRICDYTAINLNCGCPSPKVAGSGCFGAALMSEPHLVKDCVLAMSQACHTSLPITVKCRIGTDEHMPFDRNTINTLETKKRIYERLCHFVDIVSSSGVVTDFQIHARIAVLNKNFSPLDNRNIPPLQYDLAYQLVQDFPHLSFTLNGGIDSLHSVKHHLNTCQGLKGVMIGRAWVSDPWDFAMADEILYDDDRHYLKPKNRLEVLQAYGLHADAEERASNPGKVRRPLLKAITNLFTGEKNSRKYRIRLDDLASGRIENKNEVPLSELIVNMALEVLGEDVLLQSPQELCTKI